MVYELLVGPIPEGLVLDHGCRVVLCSNPNPHAGRRHEPVTVGENTRRGEAVLFSAAAEKMAVYRKGAAD